MLKDRNPTTIVVFVLMVILLLFPVLSSNNYHLRLITTIAMSIVLTTGFRLVALTGQLSIAQGAFMGIGAYFSAIMILRLGWNSWVCFFLAGFVAAVVAGIVGAITLRIKEIYFAIGTLAINELFRLIWVEWGSVSGGPGGLVNIPSPDPILGLHFGSVPSFYYMAIILLFFDMSVMVRIEKSRIGLIFTSIREFDSLAATLGVNLMKEKVKAFMIACFFAGLTGALFAHLQHFISPVDFTVLDSVYLMMYGVVGGLGSVWGPAVGCTVLGLIPVLLRLIPNYDPVIEPIIFGGILILICRFQPDGLVGLADRIAGLLAFKLKGPEKE